MTDRTEIILVLSPDASDELVDDVRADCQKLGWESEVSRGAGEFVIALLGTGDVTALEASLAGRREIDVLPLHSAREYRRLVQRRTFLTGLSGGLGLLTAAGAGLPVIGFLLPPRTSITDADVSTAGLVSDLPEGGVKRISFRGRPVLVIHREGGRFFALSAICTHMDICQVEWNVERRQLICPCHGGIFDLHGNVVQGPPAIPLQSYAVDELGGELFVRRED